MERRFTPLFLLTRMSLKSLNLRFSLDMERWLTPIFAYKNLTLRFSLDMERWLTPLDIAEQKLTVNFKFKI